MNLVFIIQLIVTPVMLSVTALPMVASLNISIPMVIHDASSPTRPIHQAKRTRRTNLHQLSRRNQRGVPNSYPKRYTSTEVKEIIGEALQITHEPRSWERPLTWMAWQESHDEAFAVDGQSAKNATLSGKSEHAEGLMQMVPSTFRRHATKDIGTRLTIRQRRSGIFTVVMAALIGFLAYFAPTNITVIDM